MTPNDDNFKEFDVEKIDILYVSMTRYQNDFKFPALYLPKKLTNIFPEIFSDAGCHIKGPAENPGSNSP